jgi:hypothetical protein
MTSSDCSRRSSSLRLSRIAAAQLLEQTAFLTAAFRRFEVRLAESGGVDEHMARALLATQPADRSLAHLVIATADRPFDPDGYWPADATLVTTIPGLERIDSSRRRACSTQAMR